MKFKHIKIEEGLSNSTIEAIFQDSRGFMWFGTRDGLNRFDGHQMVIYKYDPTDSTSITDNYITYIYEDAQKTLWVGTINGLNRFDKLKNRFIRYKNNTSDPGSLSNNYITCIYEDKKGRLWTSTLGGGINLLNPSTGSFTLYKSYNAALSKRLLTGNVNCLFEDSRNNFWIGTDNGLQLFDRTNNFFSSFSLSNQIADSVNYSIKTIKEDKLGNLLLGTNENGLIVFNYRLKNFTHYKHKATDASSISSNLVRSILVTKSGTIWTGSINGGLDLYDPVTGKFFNYQNQPENPLSLSQRTVSALYEDNQENMWIGTHRGGINLYTPKTEKFTLIRQEPDINSLSYNDVKAFCEDRSGNIWIGTDGGGLNLFDRKKNHFKHYKYNPLDPSSIGSNEVLDILEDSYGNLWVGTWGGGLCLYDRKNDKFTRLVHQQEDIKSISSNYIQKIFEDSKQNLWIATYFGGLNLYDRKTKQFKQITSDPSNNTKLTGNNIVSLNEDEDGNIWIGTDDGGLNCRNPLTGEFTHFFNNDEKKPDLRIIFRDSKDRLWIGQAGLYLFNKKQNSFSIYTDKGGLASEFIKGITEDNEGNLWISTSNGITQFNPEDLTVRKYNTADGLQGLEFEANSFMKTKDGEMFFGGVNGFNNFFPQNIITNEFVPPVFVTDFLIQNKKIENYGDESPLKKDISFTNKIILPYNQTTFSFGFAALNYTASENNQYAYKLDNWDQDWNYSGNEKKASYTNVSPGSYTFRVKASNNDGVWNEEGYSIVIIITPPFWGTWWFKIAIILLIVGVVATFLRFKRTLEFRKLEERKKEEMLQVQLQFFTNISHEFRTPLSLILGPIEKLQKENPHSPHNHAYRVIHMNAARLLQLINELMDFRKSESGGLKLHVMPGNINSFLEEIMEEFSELAQQKNMTFTITPMHSNTETWFDRQILEKILINLLSNSFKYTPNKGKITVETFDSIENFNPAFQNELHIQNNYKGKKYIYFRVADNGIGISKESIQHLFERYYRISELHLGSGIGLAFVKSLSSLHKGSIHVYSEREKGTEIIIGIPCTKEDYNKNESWFSNQDTGARFENAYSTNYPSLLVPEKKNGKSSNGILPHILVVDDNEELRNFLKESLSGNYKVSEANDGKAGYEKAKEEVPDIIVSDIMMPVLNGIDFCRQIKSDIETSHIPFIMLTAKDALASKIEGTESGADYYFSKPLSIELLELTIRNIFIQKEKLRDRYVKDYFAEVKNLAHSAKDKQFLTDLIERIETNLNHPEMDIDYICIQIGMSRTKLYNKIKSLTGQSIGDFIRTIRLKKAALLMTEKDISLAEVMYTVGIQTQSYFTKAFKNEFGKTPTQFLKDLQKEKK